MSVIIKPMPTSQRAQLILGPCATQDCKNGRIAYSNHCKRHTDNVATVTKPTNVKVSSEYGSHDALRATGRTKRMLLNAALKLSENNEVTIVIAADTAAYAATLKKDLLDILCVTFGRGFTSSLCVSRIHCKSHRDLNEKDHRCCAVFADHYRRV